MMSFCVGRSVSTRRYEVFGVGGTFDGEGIDVRRSRKQHQLQQQRQSDRSSRRASTTNDAHRPATDFRYQFDFDESPDDPDDELLPVRRARSLLNVVSVGVGELCRASPGRRVVSQATAPTALQCMKTTLCRSDERCRMNEWLRRASRPTTDEFEAP